MRGRGQDGWPMTVLHQRNRTCFVSFSTSHPIAHVSGNCTISLSVVPSDSFHLAISVSDARKSICLSLLVWMEFVCGFMASMSLPFGPGQLANLQRNWQSLFTQSGVCVHWRIGFGILPLIIFHSVNNLRLIGHHFYSGHSMSFHMFFWHYKFVLALLGL